MTGERIENFEPSEPMSHGLSFGSWLLEHMDLSVFEKRATDPKEARMTGEVSIVERLIVEHLAVYSGVEDKGRTVPITFPDGALERHQWLDSFVGEMPHQLTIQRRRRNRKHPFFDLPRIAVIGDIELTDAGFVRVDTFALTMRTLLRGVPDGQLNTVIVEDGVQLKPPAKGVNVAT